MLAHMPAAVNGKLKRLICFEANQRRRHQLSAAIILEISSPRPGNQGSGAPAAVSISSST